MDRRRSANRPERPADERYFDHLGDLGVADQHPFGEAATLRLLEALQPESGQRLLELGCGTGKTLTIAGRESGLELFGLDRSLAMLRAARRRLRHVPAASRIRLVRADARRLPWLDRSFDGVYAESVVCFQDDEAVASILSEVARVLRPGGRFVLNEAIWRPGVPQEVASELHARAVRELGVFQTGERALDVDGWNDRFVAAGFEVDADRLLDARRLPSAPSRGTLQPLGARLAMLLHRVARSLDPEVHRERRRMRRLDLELRHHGRRIEARLFVLHRSEGTA